MAGSGTELEVELEDEVAEDAVEVIVVVNESTLILQFRHIPSSLTRKPSRNSLS